jgi:ketosteroid isomerase-like protein
MGQMDEVRRGLVAWQRGDVARLTELFAPDVELLWWTPGDWDCHGRDAVLTLLSERAASAPPAEVDITEVDPNTVLVERRNTVPDGPEAGLRPATLVRLQDGKVVHMRQYRSRQDAIAEAHPGEPT